MIKLNVVYLDNTSIEKEESRIVPGYFGWDKLEEKPITRLELLTKGQSILLTNYDFYNLISQIKQGHFVGIWLMGRIRNLVEIVHVDFQRGEIHRDQLPIGTDIIEGGWRKGYVSEMSKPSTFVIPHKKS